MILPVKYLLWLLDSSVHLLLNNNPMECYKLIDRLPIEGLKFFCK